MLKLKSLVMFVLLMLGSLHQTVNAASNPAMVPIITYLLSGTSFSFSDIVGKTKYFANENGIMGYRDFVNSNTYDGEVNGEVVSGTYTYDKNSMTLMRDDGTILIFTNPRATEFGDGMMFDLSVNGSSTIETYSYDTEEERNTAYAQAMSYSYEEVASNTYYGAKEDGTLKFVVTYADLGNNDRNLTLGSFDQTNDLQQTFTIDQNVMTLGNGATITRIAKYTDYSLTLVDLDGAGPDEADLRRSYSDRTKAEAFYDSVTVSFVSDVMPIFVDVDKGNCISCHTTSGNRIFKVGDAASTYTNITNIDNNLTNIESPDLSLILIKGNGGDGHNKGEELDQLSDDNSKIVRNWIAQGGLNN